METQKISNRNISGSFQETLICVNRVTKVVKGGRVFSFAALVVIGDKNGTFGFGLGKAKEVIEARKKAVNNAKNNLYYVNLRGGRTITHQVEASYGPSKVIIKPALPGKGIIAGGAVRIVLELLGAKDVVAKLIGSSNPHNVLRATVEALMKTRSPGSVAYIRDRKVKDLKLSGDKRRKESQESIADNNTAAENQAAEEATA